MHNITQVKRAQAISRQIVINAEWCKGCGICTAFCPKGVLELDQNEKAKWARPEDCLFCGLCELRCPDVAIELVAGSAPCPDK